MGESYSKRIEQWIPDIKKAINDLKLIDPDAEKITPAFVCAFLDKESGGDPNAYIPGIDSIRVKYRETIRGGKKINVPVKISPIIDKTTGRKKEYGYGIRTIMGGFQGSAVWRNESAYYVLKDKKFETWKEYADHIANNRYNQAKDFVASQLASKNKHFLRPDLMAITHSRGGQAREDFLSSFTNDQKQQIKSGQAVTGDVTSSAQYAYDWVQPSRKTNKIMYTYAKGIQKFYKKWAAHPLLQEKDPDSKFVIDWSGLWPNVKKGPPRGSSDTIYGGASSNIRDMPDYIPFISGRFVTPEELRKGIIAQVYHINDWHLAQLATPKTENDVDGSDQVDQADSILNKQVAARKARAKGGQFSLGEDQSIEGGIKAVRADLDFDERRRYIQSLVEAEFYRRRFANRGTPPIHGPFTPRALSGFPGLVMTPTRPIIGYVDSVNHSIDVESAEGSTSISMRAPRYWNEGEVWYWLGGKDDTQSARFFPQWHNRNCVATNNYSIETGEKVNSELDSFYQYLIGCDAINYQSNHSDIEVDDDLVKQVIADRKVKGTGFEVSPETLEIREYNMAIAATDEDGKFMPGTIAHLVYGPVKPSSDNRPIMPVKDQVTYGERYGVTEREMHEEFLGNKFASYEHRGKRRILLYGPTYSNQDGRPNQLQQVIMDWMSELEERTVGGGT